MLATKGFGIRQYENALDILLPLPTLHLRLALLEHSTVHHLFGYRHTCYTADALGQFKALVITSMTLTATGQRNRNQQVDALEEASLTKLLGYHLSHLTTYLRTVVVFQVVEDIGRFGASHIVNKAAARSMGMMPQKSRAMMLSKG